MLVVPARKGAHARLPKGGRIRIVNTHGTQVIDLWAFDARDPRRYMSMSHTHSFLKRMYPKPGEPFVTWERYPILTVVEDASSGDHDTAYPCCDEHRYRLEGVKGFHDSCANNLKVELEKCGATMPVPTPQPFNLWMNVKVREDARIDFMPPTSKPGDYMILEAAMDSIVVMSACPYDLGTIPVNGAPPRDCHFEII
jgi:uncharacterized protein YcgI (DUF1989 family)